MNDIIDFKKLKEIKEAAKAAPKEPIIMTPTDIGADEFIEDLRKAQSFVGVAFDPEGVPHVAYGGNIDLIKVVGMLEIIKSEFTEYARNSFEPTEE